MDVTNSDYTRVKYYTLHRLRKSSVVEGGCLLWRGVKQKFGYGKISVTMDGVRRIMYTHRAMWELTKDETLGRGDYVAHYCGNPECLSIDHMYIKGRA